MNPPISVPPVPLSRISAACATCGDEITSASPIITLDFLPVHRAARVCWGCAELYLENPAALAVQYALMVTK